jgi:hypothetical protein
MKSKNHGTFPLLRTWTKLMLDGAGVMSRSHEVMSRRLWMIGTSGLFPGVRTAREVIGMTSEKSSVARESAQAMAMTAWVSGMRAFANMNSPQARSRGAADLASATAAKVLRSGLAPIRKKVSANAKRLRRSK